MSPPAFGPGGNSEEEAMFKNFLAALAALLLFPALAGAADCDSIASRTSGSYTVETLYLLDSDTADGVGGVCDLNGWGNPDFIRVAAAKTTACTRWTVTVDEMFTTGEEAHEIGQISSTTGTPGKQFKVDAPIARYIRGTLTQEVACTDLDVVVELWINNDETTGHACHDLIWVSAVNPTEAGATPDFLDFEDHAGSTTANNEDNYLVHQTRRAQTMACDVDVAPGGTDEWAFTLQQGAAGSLTDTTLTCTIVGAATSATSSGFIDLTAGNYIMVELESDTGAGDPDAAAAVNVSLCLGN